MKPEDVLYQAAYTSALVKEAEKDLAERRRSGAGTAALTGAAAALGAAGGSFAANYYTGKRVEQALGKMRQEATARMRAFHALPFLKKMRFILKGKA